MRFNIGSSSTAPAGSSSSSPQLSLPSDHPQIPTSSRSGAPPAGCPMHDSPPSITPAIASSSSTSSIPRSRTDKPAECPIPHDQRSLHPLNRIPLGLSSTERAPGQVLDLPTDRETSSIPRPHRADEGDAPEDRHEGKWEYPSPQQFYNALVRKGWETPEESIEMVVAIHNFLNERAWDEVMKWEKRLPGGEHAQLARFEGKPGELSPKARLHLWAGKVFPSRFNTEPPFDRHDWIVTRPDPVAVPAASSTITTTQTLQDGSRVESSTTTSSSSTPTSASHTQTSSSTTTAPTSITSTTSTTRYVIDYYDAGKDEDGNPVFSLDVRPALDSFQSISERIKVGLEEMMKGENGQ